MATEKGVVLEAHDGIAWVKTERSSACESCCSKGACMAVGGGNEMKVEVINSVGASEGDKVVLSFGSSSLLKATFLLYMFPILCLLAGAIAGIVIAPLLDMDGQMFSAILSFSFFLAAVIIVRARGNRMAQKEEYKPKIIRIMKRSDKDG